MPHRRGRQRMIRCFDDKEALGQAAADLIADKASEAVAARGRFSVFLSGGGTPVRTYELLARPGTRRRTPWPAMDIFWGDERCVPSDDVRSNFRMARQALLDHVPATPGKVHPMDGTAPPGEGAAAYEALLKAELGSAAPDLILLGLGENGHTASLFPDTPVLKNDQNLVCKVRVAGEDFDRITLTALFINRAQWVVFLVTGRAKASILAQVLQGPIVPRQLPAQAIQPNNGRLYWMVDRAAAANLDLPASD